MKAQLQKSIHIVNFDQNYIWQDESNPIHPLNHCGNGSPHPDWRWYHQSAIGKVPHPNLERRVHGVPDHPVKPHHRSWLLTQELTKIMWVCDVHHDSPIDILEEDLIKHSFWPECFTGDYYKPYTTTVNNIQGDKGNVTKEDTNTGLNNIANFIFLHKSAIK